ncbi:hypothetical protein ACWXVL_02315 [Mycoplasma sp. 128]|uniref:hypothetical protein n=1 Tax=Mycoplasma sp. 3341 TaxID=3447506 RepID=UPI003F656AF9
MLVYAIIPPLIAILAWLMFKMRSLSKKTIFLTGFGTLLLLTILFVVFISTQYSLIQSGMSAKKPKLVSIQTVMIVSSLCILTIWAIAIFCLFMSERKSFQNFFVILIIVFTIIIIFRWLWGPFAYITFYNRYFARSSKWAYGDYYFYFMIPIMFKTLIEIPVYAFILFGLQHLIIWMQKQFKNQQKMRYFN